MKDLEIERIKTVEQQSTNVKQFTMFQSHVSPNLPAFTEDGYLDAYLARFEWFAILQ